MKYMGIDYGTKRIGIATSDDEGAVAFPYATLPNRSLPKSVEEVLNIIRAENVYYVVLGESRNYQGEANPVLQEAMAFKDALEAQRIPVIWEPEFLTTAQAGRSSTREVIDASAAALILQSYLDRQNNYSNGQER